MSKNIDPGEGWRLLENGEQTEIGDMYRHWNDNYDDWRAVRPGVEVTNNYLYRRRITNGWVKTSERLPTKEDGDSNGRVLVWTKGMQSAFYLDYITTANEYWRKLPPPPIPEQSEEDKAFRGWFDGTNHVGCKEAWDARGEWEKTRGKK